MLESLWLPLWTWQLVWHWYLFICLLWTWKSIYTIIYISWWFCIKLVSLKPLNVFVRLAIWIGVIYWDIQPWTSHTERQTLQCHHKKLWQIVLLYRCVTNFHTVQNFLIFFTCKTSNWYFYCFGHSNIKSGEQPLKEISFINVCFFSEVGSSVFSS